MGTAGGLRAKSSAKDGSGSPAGQRGGAVGAGGVAGAAAKAVGSQCPQLLDGRRQRDRHLPRAWGFLREAVSALGTAAHTAGMRKRHLRAPHFHPDTAPHPGPATAPAQMTSQD